MSLHFSLATTTCCGFDSNQIRWIGCGKPLPKKTSDGIVKSTLTASGRKTESFFGSLRIFHLAVFPFLNCIRARTTGSAMQDIRSSWNRWIGAWVLRARARRWSRKPSADSLALLRMGDKDPWGPKTHRPVCASSRSRFQAKEARFPGGAVFPSLSKPECEAYQGP